MRLKGKHAVAWIVVVYCPVEANCNALRSTYRQQAEYWENIGVTTCPRAKLLMDLKAAMSDWISAGERLMVMGDFNSDTTSGQIQDFFDAFDMREAVLHRHPVTVAQALATGTEEMALRKLMAYGSPPIFALNQVPG